MGEEGGLGHKWHVNCIMVGSSEGRSGHVVT